MIKLHVSRDSSVNMMSRLQLGQPRDRGSIRSRGKRYYPALLTSYWAHQISVSSGTSGAWAHSSELNNRGVKVTIRFHYLGPRLTVSGTVPLLPICSPLPLPLHLGVLIQYKVTKFTFCKLIYLIFNFDVF